MHLVIGLFLLYVFATIMTRIFYVENDDRAVGFSDLRKWYVSARLTGLFGVIIMIPFIAIYEILVGLSS